MQRVAEAEALGSERLTAAMLDWLTHHRHIFESNGESDRVKDGHKRPIMENDAVDTRDYRRVM